MRHRFLGLLLLALPVGCDTGPLSLGWNDADPCRPTECGSEPNASAMCPDGGPETFVCRSDAMNGNVCRWHAECAPVLACELAHCGSPPSDTMCPSNTMPVVACQLDGAGNCSWQETCRQPGGDSSAGE